MNNKKQERLELAERHTKYMSAQFNKKIQESYENTIIYDSNSVFSKNINKKNTEIILEPLTSSEAVEKYSKDEKTALLNFASYKNPGGGFIKGSFAQEEALCHDSFLYNVLINFLDSYYTWNREHLNNSLYLDRALYSPNIYFVLKNKTFVCDVITCAAPNKSAAIKCGISNKENLNVLEKRLNFVFNIAKENNVETLILGAWGCGVFGQNPKELASLYKKLLKTYTCFNKVVFAIPKDRFGNYDSFKEILQDQ